VLDFPILLVVDILLDFLGECVLVKTIAKLDNKLKRLGKVKEGHVSEYFVVVLVYNTYSYRIDDKLVKILFLLNDFLLLKDCLREHLLTVVSASARLVHLVLVFSELLLVEDKALSHELLFVLRLVLLL